MSDPNDYSNPWISLGDLQSRTVEAYDFYLGEKEFDLALLLTESMHPLLPTPRVTELEGEVSLPVGAIPVGNGPVGRSGFSGHPGRRPDGNNSAWGAMRMRDWPNCGSSPIPTRDDLWAGSQCYMEGHDYIHAVELLQEYLNNGSRQRHPQALVDLGEAQLNLGRMDGALAAFEECIEFHPRDAAAYRARLIASQAHSEKGEMEQAETLLDTNLNGHLAPGSMEWRDSLFAMGGLYYRQARYEEAAERLEEAVRRLSRLRPGHCPRITCLPNATARKRRACGSKWTRIWSQSVRQTNLRRVYNYLTKAGEHYAFVQQALNERQESRQLTEVERKTLRNCYFAIGATWFDLGEYESAIRSYTAGKHARTRTAPKLWKRMCRSPVPISVRAIRERRTRPCGAARRCSSVLESQGDFLQSTNLDAEQWKELLGWMKTL